MIGPVITDIRGIKVVTPTGRSPVVLVLATNVFSRIHQLYLIVNNSVIILVSLEQCGSLRKAKMEEKDNPGNRYRC